MEGVDETSLQQVQYLDCAVSGTSNQVVAGRVEGKTVDCCTVDWSKGAKTEASNSISSLLQFGDNCITFIIGVVIINLAYLGSAESSCWYEDPRFSVNCQIPRLQCRCHLG